MTCDDQTWTEDDALADAYFATGTERQLFDDYWDLLSRVNRWRARHAPTASRPWQTRWTASAPIASGKTGTSRSKAYIMTASAFYSLAALILIAPHTSAPIAKAGTVFFLFASLIALAIEHNR